MWPDNLLVVNVFIAMSTQWRIGMTGATGLDYGALPEVLRMSGIARGEWPDIFDGVRVMEDAALETMRKAKK